MCAQLCGLALCLLDDFFLSYLRITSERVNSLLFLVHSLHMVVVKDYLGKK